MAFEDHYNGVERIDIGYGYWIDVKACMSYDDQNAAEKLLHRVKGTMGEDGKMKTVVDPDVESARFERVVRSIVDWNLDEKDGSIWVLAPDHAKRKNIKRLPATVFNKVYDRIEVLNRTDQEERANFRGQLVSGTEDGDGGATEPAEVPA
ncbi:hypothetical protein ORV05_04990 [Amycolatopsis cynarae]|uniref:Uncharacterized protein n=1 Tax=Amycolatopsis cynarae TaxID=2995223 RepID=A0ABY7B8U2_9PSEU|nr:hypothetical protein [Amycolatopsis sp. HUAS 11-8]WAL67148.1 hypothetical protein ORV05_04990 [Amycolatopsis sp. HUAS 11-8]